jgi:hypothetical protein
MSNETKIYVPGSAKQISEKLLKLNFPADELIALVKQHEKNGWISFGVSPRREIGPKGQTHTMWVDQWQPQGGFQKMRQAVEQPQRELPEASDVPAPKQLPENDDVPF